MKTIKDRNGKEITKGSIVRYGNGHYRISAIIGITVNLKSVFGSRIYYQRIPAVEVVEDEAAWYKLWQESETYKCM